MNVKKFAQDKVKKVKYQKFLKQNKQNMCSVDDSKFKQFSVDLHKLSTNQQYHHKKIIKQQISIFLQNQSQSKTFNQKSTVQSELKQFITKLDQDRGDMYEFLDQQLLQLDQLRADQIKRLISVLKKKLITNGNKEKTPQSRQNSGKNTTRKGSNKQSFKSLLSQQSVLPYLTQELKYMEIKLNQLRQSKHQFQGFGKIQKMQKQYIRHTLQSVYNRQLKQVQDLDTGRSF